MLRLLFQCQLPIELNSISNDEIQLNEDTKLFGKNSITKEVLLIFDSIFIQLLNCQIKNNLPIQYSSEYDAKIINDRIINHFNCRSSCPPIHVIILEADDNSNKDACINAICDQYFNDLQINDDSGIKVVCDEAIF